MDLEQAAFCPGLEKHRSLALYNRVLVDFTFTTIYYTRYQNTPLRHFKFAQTLLLKLLQLSRKRQSHFHISKVLIFTAQILRKKQGKSQVF